MGVSLQPAGGPQVARGAPWERKSYATPPLPHLGALARSTPAQVPIPSALVEATSGDRVRVARYAMREVSQELSPSKAVRLCGRRACGPDGKGTVTLEVTPGDGSARFSGLLRCNSVWQCPVCAPRIMRDRGDALGAIFDGHAATRGRAVMVTLTAPHDYGDSLKSLQAHVSHAWRKVTTGAPWARWKRRAGVIGFARALEVTHGVNGWHPHVHALLFLDAKGQVEPEQIRRWFYARWALAITAGTGLRWPSKEHGCIVTIPRQGDYLAKMGLSAELTSATTKEGRAGHRTPWQILRDLTTAEPGTATEARDTALWVEWAEGMKGARQVTFSRGLKARYPQVEQLELLPAPDAEASEEGAEIVAAWSADEWARLVRADRGGFFRVAALSVGAYPRGEWAALVAEWQRAALATLPRGDSEQTETGAGRTKRKRRKRRQRR